MVLMYSAFVNYAEHLSVLMMDSIIFPILSFSSFSVLQIRDSASITNCSTFNFVYLEVISFT